MDERVIIGIDPGLATIGFSFLRFIEDQVEILDFGVIETPPSLPFSERLVMIFEELLHLIDRYNPTESYVEELFFSANVKTALDVAQARGVILAALSSRGLRPYSLKPNEIKLSLTGDGSADKRQVQDMLLLQLDLSVIPRPDDAADALAVAFCGGMMMAPGSCSFRAHALS